MDAIEMVLWSCFSIAVFGFVVFYFVLAYVESECHKVRLECYQFYDRQVLSLRATYRQEGVACAHHMIKNHYPAAWAIISASKNVYDELQSKAVISAYYSGLRSKCFICNQEVKS